jgi:hypothetical protein
VAVRSLPIAGNRWPPPPPPSFFAEVADVLPRRADTVPAATARTATTPKRAYTHGINSSLTKQGPVDEAGSNGHANGQHVIMREPLWLRNPKVLREGSPGAEVFALSPEAAKAAVRAAKALPTPVPLPPPATTPLPLPPPARSSSAPPPAPAATALALLQAADVWVYTSDNWATAVFPFLPPDAASAPNTAPASASAPETAPGPPETAPVPPETAPAEDPQ